MKYPWRLLTLIPMIPCLVALTIAMPHDVLRWPIVLILWGALCSTAIEMILNTYIAEE